MRVEGRYCRALKASLSRDSREWFGAKCGEFQQESSAGSEASCRFERFLLRNPNRDVNLAHQGRGRENGSGARKWEGKPYQTRRIRLFGFRNKSTMLKKCTSKSTQMA